MSDGRTERHVFINVVDALQHPLQCVIMNSDTQKFCVCFICICYIVYIYFMSLFLFRNLNFGRSNFLLGGGESNPGPNFSKFMYNGAIGACKIAQKGASKTANFLFPSYGEWFSTFSQYASLSGDYAMLGAHAIRLYTSMVDFMATFLYRMTAITSLDLYSRVVVFCLNVYETITCMRDRLRLDVVIRPRDIIARAQAGPLESFVAATFLSTMLPKAIHGIIKDIPTFTNFKILDDASWIFDMFYFVTSLPQKICGLLFDRSEKTAFLFDYLNLLEDFLPFNVMSKNHFLISGVLDKFDKKNSIVGDKGFQDEVMAIDVSYVKSRNKYLETRRDLPGYLQDHDKRFRRLVNKVKYMRSNLRVEPVAVVFNGPRGTGKTTLMGRFMEGLSHDNSIYVHASQEDKDFHDQYDNEDVYVVDDIGQKGVWQWANMINFVSTTKYPLLCAEADKKSTKFFTSRLILATTNRIDITLTADCGISDIGALKRRLINFDFHRVTFREGVFSGDIEVKDYDLTRNEWKIARTFNASDDDILQQIKGFVDERMKARLRNAATMVAPVLGALPQGLVTSSKVLFKEVILFFRSCMPDVFDFSEIAAEFGERVAGNKVTLGALSIFGSCFLYGVYSMFNKVEEVSAVGKQFHYTAAKRSKVSIKNALPQSIEHLFMARQSELEIPQLAKFKNQIVVVQADFVRGSKKVMNKTLRTVFCSTIAGRYFTAPMHALNLEVGDEVYCTVFVKPNSICYDKVKCNVSYVNFKDDFVMLELPLGLPSYFGNIKVLEDSSVRDLVLCTPGGLFPVDTALTQLDCRVSYKDFTTQYTGTLTHDTSVLYEAQEDGACGSLLLTADGFVLGHHVAMTLGEKEQGCAKLFSQKTVDKIRFFFSEKVDYAVVLSKKLAEGSIARVEDRVYNHISTKSKYEPSLIHGVFPEYRIPANLNVYGKETIHVMSEKSRKPVASIDLVALEYAKDYLEAILPEASVLMTEQEVVLGNNQLNKIDRDSSVGYGLAGSKSDYLDFDNGKIKDTLKRPIHEFVNSAVDGSFKFDMYYAETLKDELKNVEKANKPRAFKAGPLILTLLYRFLFGNLMTKTSEQRMGNGIMIGINPLSEQWNVFARKLLAFSTEFFDGDWGDWDGGMLTPVQQAACDVMCRKIHNSSNYKVFNEVFGMNITSQEYDALVRVLVVMLYMTPTVTGDRAYITTHSMPSGSAVTAFFNSGVNKSYGAYVFYVLFVRKFGVPPSLEDYMHSVLDCVYGDDKIVAVKPHVKDWYNGGSFSSVAVEMGLRFTPADKGEWTYGTRSLFDCSFLKRGFYVHRKIGKVVAPLELISMMGTLNFVSDGFRVEELTEVKMKNFQREAFLHCDRYQELMGHLEKFAKSKGLSVLMLSDTYLATLYSIGEYGSFLELN